MKSRAPGPRLELRWTGFWLSEELYLKAAQEKGGPCGLLKMSEALNPQAAGPQKHLGPKNYCWNHFP